MKESDKNIENLIEKMMAENTLETPSFDFTSKIMSQIHISEEAKLKAYKPLISKQIWTLIICVITFISIYALVSGPEHKLQISEMYSVKFANIFSGIHLSKNILYAVLIVPFMILIQIGVLKNYFDKKYEL